MGTQPDCLPDTHNQALLFGLQDNVLTDLEVESDILLSSEVYEEEAKVDMVTLSPLPSQAAWGSP